MIKWTSYWLYSAMTALYFVCAAIYFCYSQAKADEAGLLTPEVIINILEESVIGIEIDDTGTTTTETITTTTTTTTVTNEDTGDLLTDEKVAEMGRNQRLGGDMSSDWGGQGPASMPSGTICRQLGTDRCANITGSGNSTSAQGVPGMGTTFIQTIDVSNLGIGSKGGRTNYTIKVEKLDASDRIYMHITGKDGTTVGFAGTDILSEAGVASGFQAYSGGFNFGGTLTSLIVEVGGRNINLSIGPLFDDVTINVLYNVISTIVTEGITTIETFIALETFDDVTIDIATNIFVNNNVSIGPTGDIDISPIEEYDDASYDDVVAEIETEIGGLEEYDDGSYDMDYGSDIDTGMELTMDMDYGEDPGGYEMEPVTTDTVETEMMAEIDFGPDMDTDMMPEPEYDDTTTVGTESDYGPEPEMDTGGPMDMEPEPESGEMTVAAAEPEPEPEPSTSEPEPEPEPEPETAEPEPEPEPETAEPEPEEAEPEPEPEPQEAEEESEPETKVAKAEEKKEEPKTEAKAKPKSQQEKKQEAKQKAANKIVKKMGDKGRYDDNNQTKTLIIMQVLGNTKDFFDQGSVLRDAEIFYDITTIPDTVISDNNYAQYMLFGGSDAAHDELINLQYGDE